MKTQRIPIDRIDVTSGTQCREDMSSEHIDDIKAAIENNATIPPVHVVYDSELGTYYLVDGFHRFFAHEALDHVDIEAEVTLGTMRDAILLSCGVNSTHGLKRNNKDIKRAVLKLLADKEWSKKPNTWIAEKCCVDEKTVRNYRQSTTKIGSSEKSSATSTQKASPNAETTESAANGEAPRISGGVTFNVDELEGHAAPDMDETPGSTAETETVVVRTALNLMEGMTKKICRTADTVADGSGTHVKRIVAASQKMLDAINAWRSSL